MDAAFTGKIHTVSFHFLSYINGLPHTRTASYCCKSWFYSHKRRRGLAFIGERCIWKMNILTRWLDARPGKHWKALRGWCGLLTRFWVNMKPETPRRGVSVATCNPTAKHPCVHLQRCFLDKRFSVNIVVPVSQHDWELALWDKTFILFGKYQRIASLLSYQRRDGVQWFKSYFANKLTELLSIRMDNIYKAQLAQLMLKLRVGH